MTSRSLEGTGLAVGVGCAPVALNVRCANSATPGNRIGAFRTLQVRARPTPPASDQLQSVHSRRAVDASERRDSLLGRRRPARLLEFRLPALMVSTDPS